MRYYCYHQYDPDAPWADEEGGYVNTISEKEILEQYYPTWYRKMCAKFGQEFVDATYSFEDCLTDWCTVHWAWKSEA